MNDDIGTHGTRSVREDGSLNLPDEALAEADLDPGDDVRVYTTDDGEIVLLPWTDETVRELAGER